MSLKISSRNHWAKTLQIYLQGGLMQNQVDTVVKRHGPRAVGTTLEKSNFTCVYVQNISQYDSGEQCGPWASSLKFKGDNLLLVRVWITLHVLCVKQWFRLDIICCCRCVSGVIKTFIQAILCAEPHEVSLLSLLWYVHSGGGVEVMSRARRGAQVRKNRGQKGSPGKGKTGSEGEPR
jgi:hypothetical protein